MAAQGVPHPAIKTQHLEEEAAAEEKAEEPKPAPAAAGGEGGDDSIDLMPPKNIKGGKGKALESSIEEAFEDKPNPENSHYIADHTDKVLPFPPPSSCACASRVPRQTGRQADRQTCRQADRHA